MTEETKQPEQEEIKSTRKLSMMDEMIRNLKEIGSAALEKAEEYGKIASDKAEELTKQGKLRLDVHQLKRSRAHKLEDLGQLVYNLSQEDKLKELAKHENYLALIESIGELGEKIKAKEALMEEEAEKAGNEVEK